MERWKWWRWGRWCWWLAWGWRDANTGWRVPWTGKPRRTWEFRQRASKSCVRWNISLLTDNNENGYLGNWKIEKTLTTSLPASPRGRPARRRRRWKPRWRRGLPTPVFFYVHSFFIFHIFIFSRQHLVEEKVKPWFTQLVRHLVLDSEAREVPLTVVKSVALLTSGAVYCGTSLKLLSTKKS